MDLIEIRRASYAVRQRIDAARRQMEEHPHAVTEETVRQLDGWEGELVTLAAAEDDALAAPGGGRIASTKSSQAPLPTRGRSTTGLEATLDQRMECIPTGVYHLFDPAHQPLVVCSVKNTSQVVRRLRVTTYVEGYSAHAVTTVELQGQQEVAIRHLPTLFPSRLAQVDEQTAATVNVLVEDLDSGKLELNVTSPIPLLARTAAVLYLRDPTTGERVDLTPHLGAYVTPNAPAVQAFVRQIAEEMDDRTLTGYPGGDRDVAAVEAQVAAMFSALRRADITYINSLIAFSPGGRVTQRVRLPRETLQNRSANCIDGTLLAASLLEAMSLNPAIVIVPGHAFLGWETWPDSDEWAYLETTMIGGRASFAAARSTAEKSAARGSAAAQQGNPLLFRRWALPVLRAERGILPLE